MTHHGTVNTPPGRSPAPPEPRAEAGPGPGRPSRPVGRRVVLRAGLALAAGGAVWAAREPLGTLAEDLLDAGRDVAAPPGPRPVPTAAAREDLATFDHLGGARLHYEITGDPVTLSMDPTFAGHLDATLAAHWAAAGWSTPARLTSYGAWIDHQDGATSWHHAGRAFDVGAVQAEGGTELVSCRYDLWRGAEDAVRRAAEEAYWRLAASLHREFAYVLTYLYDEAHHNHIHVDNGASGTEGSVFRGRSPAQVPDVQAMCRHVWGYDLQITGTFDRDTRAATEEVLDLAGEGGRITTPEGWRAFLAATAAHRPGT